MKNIILFFIHPHFFSIKEGARYYLANKYFNFAESNLDVGKLDSMYYWAKLALPLFIKQKLSEKAGH